jgi:lipopolysaccharide export LptBFGC system permease protein LptF
VTAPVFGWALLISMAGFALQEALGPHMARRREVLRHELEGRTDSDLLVREPRHHRKLFVGRYNFATRQMESISLMEFHDDGMLKRILRADKGSLEPEGQIRLQTVEEQEFDTSGVPVAMPGIRAQVTRDTSITQMDLVRAAEESREEGMMLLGLSDLHARMQRNPTIPFFRVAFHARLASFFSPLILLLVGLPCLIGFERSVHSRFFSVVLSILLAGGLYALTFLFTSMGTSGMLPPVLAGWLPVIITAAGGLYLFQSILT